MQLRRRRRRRPTVAAARRCRSAGARFVSAHVKTVHQASKGPTRPTNSRPTLSHCALAMCPPRLADRLFDNFQPFIYIGFICDPAPPAAARVQISCRIHHSRTNASASESLLL
jgi:hypothetical protein